MGRYQQGPPGTRRRPDPPNSPLRPVAPGHEGVRSAARDRTSLALRRFCAHVRSTLARPRGQGRLDLQPGVRRRPGHVAIARQGAQPTLHRDLPIPEPAEGEVLVRVRASSVNGFDLAAANGYLQAMMEHRFPVVLGKDFAGTVENIGPGVDGIAPGDDVYGVVMKPYLGDGGLGEHVAAPAAFVAKVPAAVELATAGALGLAGTAAIDAVDAIAVQLLKAKGVRVIATAATSQERAFVTELGADNAVDYRGDLAAGVKALQPGGVDAALHFAGDGPSQIPQSHDARLPTSDRRSNWRQYARVSGSSYRSTGTR